MVELYFRSTTRLHGVVINLLGPGANLPLPSRIWNYGCCRFTLSEFPRTSNIPVVFRKFSLFYGFLDNIFGVTLLILFADSSSINFPQSLASVDAL
jgi:hypothetical protein